MIIRILHVIIHMHNFLIYSYVIFKFIFDEYRKRSLKVTCKIDGKIGILGSSKVKVKLTEFLNKVTCKIKRSLIKLYENLADAEDLLIVKEEYN
jgi:hypothetical protein